MSQFLSLYCPRWPITQWRRRNGADAGLEPLALVGTDRGARRLTALSEAAEALGLFAGQKATDAKALVPELITADAAPERDAAALTRLCDWCVRFSPAVAVDPPDGLMLDVSGVAHLWGGEASMAADLEARLAKSGIPARAAIAVTAGAAWARARFGEGPLHSLPVTALRLEAETSAQLARLGLVHIGDLERLGRDQLTRRFGPQLVLRLDQAFGRRDEAFAFRRPPTPWIARLAFAEPISAPEDLARVAGDIIAKLAARLEAEGKGAKDFELAFHRLDGRAETVRVRLSLPGRAVQPILRLFLPRLESIDPGFGIEVVTLAARAVETLGARQQGLDARAETALEDGLAPLVDRLVNRLGPDRVWRVEPFPSHLPERTCQRVAPLSDPKAQDWDRERPRPVRLFARPEPVEALAPIPDDPPISFRWRGRAHRVRLAEGPERLAAEWWRTPGGRARDYYRVEDETGARFWLYREGLFGEDPPPQWWLHGVFG
jgi:protein ImuB